MHANAVRDTPLSRHQAVGLPVPALYHAPIIEAGMRFQVVATALCATSRERDGRSVGREVLGDPQPECIGHPMSLTAVRLLGQEPRESLARLGGERKNAGCWIERTESAMGFFQEYPGESIVGNAMPLQVGIGQSTPESVPDTDDTPSDRSDCRLRRMTNGECRVTDTG